MHMYMIIYYITTDNNYNDNNESFEFSAATDYYPSID